MCPNTGRGPSLRRIAEGQEEEGRVDTEPGSGISPTKDATTHQKCTTTILIADIGEPPDVAEADSEAKGGEEELAMVSPLTLLVEHF